MKILKGVVYFDKYDFENSAYTGERDLGNAPAFSFNLALEKLEHFSSRGGLKAKDKEIISQITPGVTFTLDEINMDNLAMLTLATINEVDITGSDITDETHDAHLGRRIVLDYRAITAITVVDSATGLITYTQGDEGTGNYQISSDLKDDVIGRILINVDQASPTDEIIEGQSLDISYTYGTIVYHEIEAFNETIIEGRLRFVSDNPAGTQQELEVWRCSLTPSGDTAMIGDDWSTLGFTGEILKDQTNHPDSPYMTITIV